MPYLEKIKWKIEFHKIDKPAMSKVLGLENKSFPSYHIMYVCKKQT